MQVFEIYSRLCKNHELQSVGSIINLNGDGSGTSKVCLRSNNIL